MVLAIMTTKGQITVSKAVRDVLRFHNGSQPVTRTQVGPCQNFVCIYLFCEGMFDHCNK
jgi:hypothetical protein